MPIVTKHKKSPLEFYYFLEEMYAKNSNGFRTPRRRGGGSLTLLEEAGVRAGILESGYGGGLDISNRMAKKRANKIRFAAALEKEQNLREEYRKLEGVSKFAAVAPKGWEPAA